MTDNTEHALKQTRRLAFEHAGEYAYYRWAEYGFITTDIYNMGGLHSVDEMKLIYKGFYQQWEWECYAFSPLPISTKMQKLEVFILQAVNTTGEITALDLDISDDTKTELPPWRGENWTHKRERR